MKTYLSIFLSFLFLNAGAQWIDISIEADDFNTIEYIPETGDFFIGSIGGIYKWDQQEWYQYNIDLSIYTSVYNNGLLAFNRTLEIVYSTLEGNFENWEFYTTDFLIVDVFSYQDKIILLPEKYFDYDIGMHTYGTIMDNTGNIVDTLYFPNEIFDTLYLEYHYLKAGFSVGDDIFILTYYNNNKKKSNSEYNVTTLYKTDDLGINWEEVAVFDGRPLDARAKGNIASIIIDDYYNFTKLVKSYNSFETWEVEDLYDNSYIYEIDILNNIYCAGFYSPSGANAFLYNDNSGVYEIFDDLVYTLETVDIATMIAGNQGYAKIRYNDTYVETISDSSNLEVYPNPFVDIINVSTEKNTHLRLYDNTGQFIKELTGNQFDLSYLPKGIYILKSYNQFAKIIKK